ncbi:DUF5677 domain-containing protein [Micromonospora sp. DH14]|uniref:DUF5677 domain-containing protein n=1 Tax=Micromonospora sp. DH14 TaxID=3040120 RepID=UPI002440F672|nr:DUF5677 domain-containing protein [Micromonospora sp. DH14]MDG9674674.1 DUF5677 domain-containing protein [Micromonospora sp. DH14]
MPETYLSVAGPLGDVFEPPWAELQDAMDENPFIYAGVELLKSAVMLSRGLAYAPREGPLPVNAAIRCGLMVRAGKLCLDLLADVCNGQGRQQIGLLRQLTETLANVAYLSRDDEQGTRHRAYLYDSLISEREFLKVIERRRASGDDTELPIEGRLRRSIEDTARAAGIDLDAIPGRRQIGWPSAQDRIEQAFGATAYPSYRVGSDALHGGWFDLIRNHLNQVDGGFEPEFRPISQRPQALLAAAIQLSMVALVFQQHQPPQMQRFFGEHLAAVLGRAHRVDEMHERWLTSDAGSS